MTGRRGRAVPVVAIGLLLLLLNGCVVVHGGPVVGHPGPVSGDSLGLARPFLPLPVVLPAAVPDGYDPGADASAAIAAAVTASHADGRPVLLDFGSAWCDDCQALAALVQHPGLHQVLARNYHLVTVDVGHYDHNTALAARYVTLSSSGIPALVLLAPDGTPRDTGNPGQFADARNLSADDVANILVDWLYLGN